MQRKRLGFKIIKVNTIDWKASSRPWPRTTLWTSTNGLANEVEEGMTRNNLWSTYCAISRMRVGPSKQWTECTISKSDSTSCASVDDTLNRWHYEKNAELHPGRHLRRPRHTVSYCLELGKKAFAIAGPTASKNVPLSVRPAPSITTVRQLLKRIYSVLPMVHRNNND